MMLNSALPLELQMSGDSSLFHREIQSNRWFGRLSVGPHVSREQEELSKKALAFAKNEVLPTVLETDKTATFDRSVFAKLARGGLHAVAHPREYGGLGLESGAFAIMIQEIARASLSLSVTVGVTNLVQGALSRYGSDIQKDTALRKLLTGEWIGAFSLSEPHSGSDAAALRLKATATQGGYRLNGTKCWCSTAGKADVYLVMARTGEHKTRGISAFLVPKETRGFRIGKMEAKLGLKSSPLAELIFEDCFVDDSHLVGLPGQGLEVALSQLDGGRVTIASAGLGTLLTAIEVGWTWGLCRQKTGGEFPEGMRQRLAEIFAGAESVRGLILQAGILLQRGESITRVASQAKLLSSELAMTGISEILTWLGNDGLWAPCHLERIFRDAKALQIVEGTTQIQKLVLSRQLDELLSLD